MKKALKWLDINFEPLMIMVVFIIMTCLITLQVILRFGFGKGFAWGEEFSCFMFVWVTFLSIPYGFRNNRQISIDVIRNFLPEIVTKVLVLVIDVTMLVLMGIFLNGAIANVSDIAEFNDLVNSVPITLNVVYVAAVVGYGLSMVRILQTMVWRVRRFGASMEVYMNRGGVFSGANEIFFMPKHLREEELAHIAPEALEEAAKYAKTEG